MAFKRSAVRSRLSPQKNTAFHLEMRCFSNFLTIFVILGQQKSQQDQPFSPSNRRKDGFDGLHSGKGKRKENCLFQDQGLFGTRCQRQAMVFSPVFDFGVLHHYPFQNTAFVRYRYTYLQGGIA